MKKRFVLALCGCMLVLAACGNAQEVPATNEVETKEETTQTEAATTTPDNQETQDQTEESGTITDNIITADLFEITMPDEFSGLFEAEVSEGRIDIYHKESREAGFPGLIFSVWARKSPSEYAGGPYMKIGELNAADGTSYDVVKGEATEVQWDYNKEEPEDYGKIYDSFDKIIESMTATNGGTFMRGAGMKGDDLYAYTLATLIDVINDGADEKKLVDMGFATDYNGIMLTHGDDVLSKIGYAFADTNLDGIDELYIGEIDEGALYDIYTMVDRMPTHVVSGGERDRFYVYNNSFISNEQSSGPDEQSWILYNLESNSTEMVVQYAYKYDISENKDNPWFKSYDYEEWEAITEDEFNEGVKDLDAGKGLEMKPFSDIAPIDFSKVDLSKYDTFTQLVDDLKQGMGYANVSLDGTDVLLVSSGCYNWDGINAAIDASIFMYQDGKVVYLGQVQSTGTANPLAIADGKLFSSGHHFVRKSTVTDGKLMVMEEAKETFDQSGNASYTFGSDDGGGYYSVDDRTLLDKMFEENMNAEIIDFQVVG